MKDYVYIARYVWEDHISVFATDVPAIDSFRAETIGKHLLVEELSDRLRLDVRHVARKIEILAFIATEADTLLKQTV